MVVRLVAPTAFELFTLVHGRYAPICSDPGLILVSSHFGHFAYVFCLEQREVFNFQHLFAQLRVGANYYFVTNYRVTQC
uniref:Putative secreted protein ovary overexpressed n=1 Tax=Rhipicephalus microplus TaxID=6941 RepID=A0A6M2DB24_RHIMP